jgi:DNA polymerase-1
MECPRNELDPTTKLVRQVMEKAYSLRVPLTTEARFGTNWGEMESC